MRRLLVDYKCDPNVMDVHQDHNLLSYCVLNHKMQSFEMLVELCQDKLDPNIRNKD